MVVVLLWTLRVWMVLVILGWLGAWAKINRRRREGTWSLGPQHPAADPGVLVSVIIPARNEELNLRGCVESALAQDHPNLEVIVQDDASTDRTGEILAQLAAQDARIVALKGGGEALPEGWFGKPWALQRAQRAAKGRWLVFIDADVRLHPAAVSRVVAYGEREGLDMVTGFGAQTMGSFWEKVLQPAVAGLILAGNDLNDVNDPNKADKNMASGQLLAFRREAYDALGGHEAVKDNILDDVGLARAVKGAGRRYHCLFLRELYSVRMYTNLKEIWEGWSKNLFAGMRYSWAITLLVIAYTVAMSLSGPILTILGAFGLVSADLFALGLAHWLIMQGVRLTMDRIWQMNPLYGLTHAPAQLLVILIMLNSALKSRGKGVGWRGRTYQLTPR